MPIFTTRLACPLLPSPPKQNSPPNRAADLPRRKLISLVAVWIGLVVALLPVFFQWQPTAVSGGRAGRLRLDSAYLLAALLAFLLYRLERKRGSRQRAFALVLLVVLATLWTNSVHRYYVDKGSVRAEQSNFAWQVEIQREVMRLSPSVAPHSYRFLPNSLVRWLELAGFDYESARDIYRLFLNLLLFYALLRYALLFTDDTGALLALLLVAAVYPVSFEYYSGQLTDPLSHLSFLLAFIFLETEEFAFFLTALVIGSLAKETVLALAGYYVLFQRRESHYLPKALLACGASAAAYLGVRALVVHGAGVGAVSDCRLEDDTGIAQTARAVSAAGTVCVKPLFRMAVRGAELHAALFCAGSCCRAVSKHAHSRFGAGEGSLSSTAKRIQSMRPSGSLEFA